MSTRKVKRELGYTAVWATNVLTVTTNDLHYAAAGDLVLIKSPNSPQSVLVPIATVTSTTVFTVSLQSDYANFLVGTVEFSFFRTGQTGRFVFPCQHSTGAPQVVQSYVLGAGGAGYTLDASLDGNHWTNVATVTHAASNNDTQSAQVAPNWTFLSINITSIGAGTALFVNYSA